MHDAAVRGYEPAQKYSETIEEVLSAEDLEKSKGISDKLLAEIK